VKFYQRRLDNGLQVIAELDERVHSVALGFFVRTGARDETDEIAGVSHFLEHMAFKGTDRYTADDVNRIFDELGAHYNAQTSEEVTLFYAAVLPEYFGKTFELLSSILFPALRKEDFDTEKHVILEEIGMYEDTPSFLVYEKAMQAHFRGHPLGRPILGTRETIQRLTVDRMRRYHQDRYRAGNIVLAVAGKTEWPLVVELAERHCGQWPAGGGPRTDGEVQPTGGVEVVTRPDSTQQHLVLLNPAPPAKSPQRFAVELLSVIVGDTSGSRLYWELVDPGHAEVAELGYNEFDGCGAFMTFVSCEPSQVEPNLGRLRKVYDDVNRNGVTEEELKRAKNKVASRIVIRSERPMGRLASLGGNWVYRDEYRSVDDDLQTLHALTVADIRRALDDYPLGWVTAATVGPLEELPSV